MMMMMWVKRWEVKRLFLWVDNALRKVAQHTAAVRGITPSKSTVRVSEASKQNLTCCPRYRSLCNHFHFTKGWEMDLNSDALTQGYGYMVWNINKTYSSLCTIVKDNHLLKVFQCFGSLPCCITEVTKSQTFPDGHTSVPLQIAAWCVGDWDPSVCFTLSDSFYFSDF